MPSKPVALDNVVRTYLSLDVALEHTDDGYFVRIVNSPAGDTMTPFQPPFTLADLGIFHRLIATGETPLGPGETLEAELQQWGTRLFMALFPGLLGNVLQNSRIFAYRERARLRLRLQINHAPELVVLPWEYLFDPVRKEFLALSLQSSFVRYTNLMHQILPHKIAPPLRMLVVISSPGGYAPFDRESAWFTILDALDYLALEGKLIIERLNKPTLFDLQRYLRQKEYHILHFIGHGSVNEFTGEGSLIFEDEMGRGRPIHGEHLGALLRDHFSLRLVALTAGDVVRTATANPYLEIAPSLVRRGLPAVVATHSALDDGATALFAQKFYGMVANFMPIDQAMSEVRQTLFTEQHATAWGLPALFMRTADGRLFTPVQTATAEGTTVQSAENHRRRLWAGFGKR